MCWSLIFIALCFFCVCFVWRSLNAVAVAMLQFTVIGIVCASCIDQWSSSTLEMDEEEKAHSGSDFASKSYLKNGFGPIKMKNWLEHPLVQIVSYHTYAHTSCMPSNTVHNLTNSFKFGFELSRMSTNVYLALYLYLLLCVGFFFFFLKSHFVECVKRLYASCFVEQFNWS